MGEAEWCLRRGQRYDGNGGVLANLLDVFEYKRCTAEAWAAECDRHALEEPSGSFARPNFLFLHALAARFAVTLEVDIYARNCNRPTRKGVKLPEPDDHMTITPTHFVGRDAVEKDLGYCVNDGRDGDSIYLLLFLQQDSRYRLEAVALEEEGEGERI